MNKVIFIGRLTRDPEVRYASKNNTAVCSFNLAVDRRFSKQGEEKQADFFPVIAFGSLGEFCGKYFKKGRQVAVIGRLQTDTREDAEGKMQKTMKVILEEAYFADSKKDAGSQPAKNPDQSVEADGYEYTDEDEGLPF